MCYRARSPTSSRGNCDVQKALLPRLLMTNGRNLGNERAFALDHGDLKLDNIIVDEDYNIISYYQNQSLTVA